ncbi:hypothetical protein [Bradyrhizobium cenepequi]
MAKVQKPFHCPTFLESFLATSALWPRGRAWPVNDGGTTVTNYLTWLAGLVGLPTSWPTGFVQAGYTAAIAAVRNYIETRLCALRLEFWCATHSETHDQWMIEYGLPDPCDPFPDLCTKVAAIGGTRCEYYAEIAWRVGWKIDCDAYLNYCGAQAGCAQAGCDIVGPMPTQGVYLQINVYLSESPAYLGPTGARPFVGVFEAGQGLDCGPDISALECVLSRVVHAHMNIVWAILEGPVFDLGVFDNEVFDTGIPE